MSTEKLNKNINNNSEIFDITNSDLRNLKIEINETLKNNVKDIIEESCKNKGGLRLNTTKESMLNYIIKGNLGTNKDILAEAQILELSKHHLNRKLNYIVKHPKESIQDSLKMIKEKQDIINLFNANSKYDKIIKKYSNENKVDPLLIKSIIWKESRFDTNARSGAGAGGLMQLTASTAKSLLVKNVYNPDQNIRGGVKYISQLIKKYRNIPLSLAAYNAGPGNVRKYGNKIPPFKETKDYVKKIMHMYNTVRA